MDDNVADMPKGYRHYHQARIAEIREDPKRIVFVEFHRTAKAQAVRDQVIQDISVKAVNGKFKLRYYHNPWMISMKLWSNLPPPYLLCAGPEQTVRKIAEIFGLSHTAEIALKTRVHGPREDGATFLAQFATKAGLNTQLLTATLGPVELWSLNTTPRMSIFVINSTNALDKKKLAVF